MHIAKDHSVSHRLKFIEDCEQLRLPRKEGTIRIEENLTSSCSSSPANDLEKYSEAIEEVPEEEEGDLSSRLTEGEGDSILEEVDKYLAKWRNRS